MMSKYKNIKYAFSMAICVKSGTVNGYTFKEGEIYPILGNNNGIQIGYKKIVGTSSDMCMLLCHTFDVFAPVDGEQFYKQDGTIPPLFKEYIPSL